MISGRPQGRVRVRGMRWRPGAGRFLLAALLIILVLAGLRGAVAAPGWSGRYASDGTAITLALEVVLAVLLAVLAVRERQAPREEFVAARLRTMLFYLLGAAAIAIPLVVLLAHVHPGQAKGRAAPPNGSAPKPRRSRPVKPPAPVHFPLADVLYGLLVLALLAAVICCWVLVARRRRFDRPAELGPDPGGEPDELRAAVESGRSALRQLDDARAAIIACYVAMEQSLAKAGAARGVAETPDELLARAVRAGLARVQAATRLTALFYEARFSTHPLGPDQRDAAEQALTEIAASLSRLARLSPAAPAGPTTGMPEGRP